MSPDDLQAAKLRALAEFAAGAGHEINNPIATIIGYAQQLLADETDPERRHALLTIGAQAYRIRDMIGDVMLFARPPAPKPEPLDLVEVLREVVAKFQAEAEAAKIKIQADVPAPVPVLADPVQLRVVLSSLIRNSLDALANRGGSILARAKTVRIDDLSFAEFILIDDGPGLSPIDREHLFDPFYSGRQAGRGLGFGLSKAWRIITNHDGRIEVESPPAGGVIVRVLWPAPASPSPPLGKGGQGE